MSLRAGADFEEMVLAHSNDPGSKTKKGKFDKWMQMGEVGVAGPLFTRRVSNRPGGRIF